MMTVERSLEQLPLSVLLLARCLDQSLPLQRPHP